MSKAPSETFDLVISNGSCVLPSATNPQQIETVATDIGVRAGRIAAIGGGLATKANRVLNAKGLHALPGLIDTQVHLREPGLTHKEDLETGT
jgi:dihydroorotase